MLFREYAVRFCTVTLLFSELFVDWLFYSIHLRIVFAKMELWPSKVQKPTLKDGF